MELPAFNIAVTWSSISPHRGRVYGQGWLIYVQKTGFFGVIIIHDFQNAATYSKKVISNQI